MTNGLGGSASLNTSVEITVPALNQIHNGLQETLTVLREGNDLLSVNLSRILGSFPPSDAMDTEKTPSTGTVDELHKISRLLQEECLRTGTLACRFNEL